MNLSTDDIENLRGAFAVCRTAGIDAVVIKEGLIRGISPTAKMAIISPVKLSIPQDIVLGISRISEFEKRLAIFSGEIAGECKLNASNEVSVIAMKSGRSTVQFRCAAEKMIKYPKENDDTEACVVTATKAEVAQLSRAVKTLGAETLTVAIGRDSSVKVECTSPTNETFASSFEKNAEFVSEAQSQVHVYEGDRLASVLDTAARDSDEVTMVIGEYGSMTIIIKGHTLLAMPEANQEEDDE